MKLRVIHAISLAASLLIGGFAAQAAERSMPATNIHRLITQQQGWLNTSRALTPEDLQGRIILLDFWTYCCINCMHVIPDLQYLEEKFGDSLTVIGVHSAKFANERDSENIRQAILRYDIHHPVVNDFDFSTWNRFGIRAWPSFVLINPQGIIQATYSGEGNRDAMAHDIAALVKKYAGKLNNSSLPLALERDKASSPLLQFPAKLAYAEDMGGQPALFVSDSGHHRIVGLRLNGEMFITIGNGMAGDRDGDFMEAQFRSPQGLVYTHGDNKHILGMLYVADTQNHKIKAIDLDNGQVSTVAGTGTQGNNRNPQAAKALKTALSSPWALAFYPDQQHLAIAMAGTHQLWSYDIAAHTVRLLAGNGHESIDDGALPGNSLAQPSGLSASDGTLYFVDAETSSLRALHDDSVHTLIGQGLFEFGYKEGTREEARMQHPLGVIATEDSVYIADSYNHSIRAYTPSSKLLSNFAGHGERGNADGALTEARFNEPNDILAVGDKLYVADTNNHAVRIIDITQQRVSTLAIKERQTDSTPEFSESLPNTKTSPERAIGTHPRIALSLLPGWHINQDAPSYLALYDDAPPHRTVAAFGRDMLQRGPVTLPLLQPHRRYRLQAVLYYCEQQEGAQCQVKGFDIPLMTTGTEQLIRLPLEALE